MLLGESPQGTPAWSFGVNDPSWNLHVTSKGLNQHAPCSPDSCPCKGAVSGYFCQLGPLTQGSVCTPSPQLLHCPQHQLGAWVAAPG